MNSLRCFCCCCCCRLPFRKISASLEAIITQPLLHLICCGHPDCLCSLMLPLIIHRCAVYTPEAARDAFRGLTGAGGLGRSCWSAVLVAAFGVANVSTKAFSWRLQWFRQQTACRARIAANSCFSHPYRASCLSVHSSSPHCEVRVGRLLEIGVLFCDQFSSSQQKNTCAEGLLFSVHSKPFNSQQKAAGSSQPAACSPGSR